MAVRRHSAMMCSQRPGFSAYMILKTLLYVNSARIGPMPGAFRPGGVGRSKTRHPNCLAF